MARIGIIGDYEPLRPSHEATEQALRLAGRTEGIDLEMLWLPTRSLETAPGLTKLQTCQGLLAAPGGTYLSRKGTWAGIRRAREQDIPFIGT